MTSKLKAAVEAADAVVKVLAFVRLELIVDKWHLDLAVVVLVVEIGQKRLLVQVCWTNLFDLLRLSKPERSIFSMKESLHY